MSVHSRCHLEQTNTEEINMSVKRVSHQMEICGLTTRYSVKNTGDVGLVKQLLVIRRVRKIQVSLTSDMNNGYFT
jgi:hypothetical protein